MMLEEGEIDEEDLKIDDYDRVITKSIVKNRNEGEIDVALVGGGDDNDSTSRSPKHSSKSSKRKKRSRKSSHHHNHHHNQSPSILESDSEKLHSEDKDERIIVPPVVAPGPKPVSLFDLFKQSTTTSLTDSPLLVNPVITEKENKPSSLLGVIGSGETNATTQFATAGTKRQQAELKRKVLKKYIYNI